jgi:hypothetical protein
MNRAGCRSCGDIIESTHRHDYVTCRCGAISVDGGSDYQRRLFKDAPPVDLPDDAALKLFEHRYCGTDDCCGACV